MLLDSPGIWILLVWHSTFTTVCARWVLRFIFVHDNLILVGVHENSASIPGQVLFFCTPNDNCNTMSAHVHYNQSVLQCSHLGSHSGSDSVADMSSSASFPDVNVSSSMCHWHVKEMVTTFTHRFLVVLAYFQEVCPWIVYTIPVSLHVERCSSPNVWVGSDSRRLCVLVKTHPWNRCKGWCHGCSYWVRMTLQGWVEWGGTLLVFVFIHAGHKTALTVVAVAHSQLINAWCYANRICIQCPCFNFLAIDWFCSIA